MQIEGFAKLLGVLGFVMPFKMAVGGRTGFLNADALAEQKLN